MRYIAPKNSSGVMMLLMLIELVNIEMVEETGVTTENNKDNDSFPL